MLSIWSQGKCKEISFAAPQRLYEILERMLFPYNETTNELKEEII